MSKPFPTPSVTRDRKQRNSQSRFRRPESHSQSKRAIGIIREGSEPQIDSKEEISSNPSLIAPESEARFEPKSILPTSKSTKTISQLRETSLASDALQKEEAPKVSFECIDNITRTIRRLEKHSERAAGTSSSEKREQFTAFGIQAYPTRALHKVICYDFVISRRWCPNGSHCNRIHPLNKSDYIAAVIRERVQILRTRQVERITVSTDEPPSIDAPLSPSAPLSSTCSVLPAVSPSGPAPSGVDCPRVKLPPLPKPLDTEPNPPLPTNPLGGSFVDAGIQRKGRMMRSSPRHGYPKSSPRNHRSFNNDIEHLAPLKGLKEAGLGEVSGSDSDYPHRSATTKSGQTDEESDNLWHSSTSRWHTTGSESSSQHDEAELLSDIDKPSASQNQTPTRFSGSETSNSQRPRERRSVACPSTGFSATALTTTSSSIAQRVSFPNQRHCHPRPKTNERCRAWLRNQCILGYNCKYIHEDLEYDNDTTPESMSRVLHQHIRISFGLGFCVNELITGFETHGILIGGFPDVPDAQILELLKPFGQVKELVKPPLPIIFPMTVKAYFDKPSEAFTALTSLHGKEFLGHKLEAKTKERISNRLFFRRNEVRFEWDAPHMPVFVGYANRLLAQQAIDDTQSKPYGDFITFADVHVGRPAVGAVTVKFQYLPFDVDPHKMKIFGPHQGMVSGKMNFVNVTPQDMTRGFRRVLSSMSTVEIVEMGFRHPPYRDGKMRAWVVFASVQDAQIAVNTLDGKTPKCMGGTTIKAFQVKSISFALSLVKYGQVRAEIQVLQNKLYKENKGHWITVSEKGGVIHVRISGDDLKVLGRLKAEFEKVLNGEALYYMGKMVWDSFFRWSSGREFLHELQREFPEVTIEASSARSTIRLFGVEEKRALVRGKIIDKVRERRATTRYVIQLRPDVINAYAHKGDGFRALDAELGHGNVILNQWDNQLVILGDRDTITVASDAVFAFQQRHNLLAGHRLKGDVCPACFGLTSVPIKLPCGHAWCRSCLQRYLKFATEDETTFPLLCHGINEKCGESIPLFTARSLLSPDDFEAVLHSAFSAHIRTHPEEFHYCPTPDCQQIYRSTPEGIFMQCPECLTQICTHCHSEAHDGFTCKEAHDGDGLFQEWAAENHVKQCPRCMVAIDKTEGCNHVTCPVCQTHICWVCMQTFENGLCIYGHMQAEHGGSGV